MEKVRVGSQLGRRSVTGWAAPSWFCAEAVMFAFPDSDSEPLVGPRSLPLALSRIPRAGIWAWMMLEGEECVGMREDMDGVALELGDGPVPAGWAGNGKEEAEDGDVVGADSVVMP